MAAILKLQIDVNSICLLNLLCKKTKILFLKIENENKKKDGFNSNSCDCFIPPFYFTWCHVFEVNLEVMQWRETPSNAAHSFYNLQHLLKTFFRRKSSLIAPQMTGNCFNYKVMAVGHIKICPPWNFEYQTPYLVYFGHLLGTLCPFCFCLWWQTINTGNWNVIE